MYIRSQRHSLYVSDHHGSSPAADKTTCGMIFNEGYDEGLRYNRRNSSIYGGDFQSN